MKLLENVLKHVLISEGRREDLIKKYRDKFGEALYYYALNDELSKSTNYKYVDWILSKTPDSPQEQLPYIDKSLRLLRIFDKIQSNLEKKDINQYNSLEDLENTIEFYNEVKGPKPDFDKIYEDDKFLVIVPKNEQASCKYGANTKWCITSRGSAHFERYTQGRQELYFIINKTNSKNENYSKVAVHVNENGGVRYYDSKDRNLTDEEIQILNYAFPEMMKSIKDDYNKRNYAEPEEKVKEIFDDYLSSKIYIQNFLYSKYGLYIFVDGFSNVEGMEFGHADGEIKIYLSDGNNTILIDSYIMFLRYSLKNDTSISVSIGFSGTDSDEIGKNYIDLGLEFLNLDLVTDFLKPKIEVARKIKEFIGSKILNVVKEQSELIKKIVGNKKFWTPNRGSYGYTFKKNKGLISQLVDWLDEDIKGTRLDFLTYIGKLDKKIKNGKEYYSFKGRDSFLPSSRWRGHFSGFFASAKNAGILSYTKSGNKFYLTKGPNFNDFKNGELEAL